MAPRHTMVHQPYPVVRYLGCFQAVVTNKALPPTDMYASVCFLLQFPQCLRTTDLRPEKWRVMSGTEAGLPPWPPDLRPLVPSSSPKGPSYWADFPSLSCFSLLGYEVSAVFPHVVFGSLREILLECPVPSPSEFPALFNCSR